MVFSLKPERFLKNHGDSPKTAYRRFINLNEELTEGQRLEKINLLRLCIIFEYCEKPGSFQLSYASLRISHCGTTVQNLKKKIN